MKEINLVLLISLLGFSLSQNIYFYGEKLTNIECSSKTNYVTKFKIIGRYVTETESNSLNENKMSEEELMKKLSANSDMYMTFKMNDLYDTTCKYEKIYSNEMYFSCEVESLYYNIQGSTKSFTLPSSIPTPYGFNIMKWELENTVVSLTDDCIINSPDYTLNVYEFNQYCSGKKGYLDIKINSTHYSVLKGSYYLFLSFPNNKYLSCEYIEKNGYDTLKCEIDTCGYYQIQNVYARSLSNLSDKGSYALQLNRNGYSGYLFNCSTIQFFPTSLELQNPICDELKIAKFNIKGTFSETPSSSFSGYMTSQMEYNGNYYDTSCEYKKDDEGDGYFICEVDTLYPEIQSKIAYSSRTISLTFSTTIKSYEFEVVGTEYFTQKTAYITNQCYLSSTTVYYLTNLNYKCNNGVGKLYFKSNQYLETQKNSDLTQSSSDYYLLLTSPIGKRLKCSKDTSSSTFNLLCNLDTSETYKFSGAFLRRQAYSSSTGNIYKISLNNITDSVYYPNNCTSDLQFQFDSIYSGTCNLSTVNNEFTLKGYMSVYPPNSFEGYTIFKFNDLYETRCDYLTYRAVATNRYETYFNCKVEVLYPGIIESGSLSLPSTKPKGYNFDILTFGSGTVNINSNCRGSSLAYKLFMTKQIDYNCEGGQGKLLFFIQPIATMRYGNDDSEDNVPATSDYYLFPNSPSGEYLKCFGNLEESYKLELNVLICDVGSSGPYYFDNMYIRQIQTNYSLSAKVYRIESLIDETNYTNTCSSTFIKVALGLLILIFALF